MVTPASQRILCRMMRSLGFGCCQGVGAKQLFARKTATDDMGVRTAWAKNETFSMFREVSVGHRSGSHLWKSRGNQSPGKPAEAVFSNSSAVGLCR